MGRKEVFKNAGQIAKYLEVLLPKLEPSGGLPTLPMNRKERGSSRPPVSEYVMDLWQANPHAGRINEVLREAARSHESVQIEGRAMWKILGDCLFDHTAIRRWKAAGGVEERRLWQMCLLLAQRLAIKHDRPEAPYELTVHTSPDDDTLEASEWQTAHNRDNNEKRRHDARESYKRIYPQWVAFEKRYPEATRTAAKGMFCDWYEREHRSEISVRKLERVIAFCERGEYDENLRGSRRSA